MTRICGARRDVEMVFHGYLGPVKLVHATWSVKKGMELLQLWRSCDAHACMFVRRHIESSFHHCRVSAKFVQASLGARKNVEGIFHHCGGPGKLVYPSWSAQRDPNSIFSPSWMSWEVVAWHFQWKERPRKQFPLWRIFLTMEACEAGACHFKG